MATVHEPRHRKYNTPLSEWIELIPNELDIDAVGLWQIVAPIREGFDLDGQALEAAVRESLEALVSADAIPVQGNNIDKCWHVRADLAYPTEFIVEKVLNYWLGLGRDPDVGDIWFAKPEMCAGQKNA